MEGIRIKKLYYKEKRLIYKWLGEGVLSLPENMPIILVGKGL
jgi:hypothetical protein